MHNQFHKLLIFPDVFIVDDIDLFKLEIRKLIEYSAHQIIIPKTLILRKYDTKTYDYNSQLISTEDYLQNLTPMIQRKIKTIKYRKIRDKIDNFVSPLYEIDSPVIKIDGEDTRLNYVINTSAMELVIIYLASKYECSSFITTDITRTLNSFKTLKKYAKEEEQKDTMALIEGILNIYVKKELENFSIRPKDYISIKDRLDAVLEDAEMIKNSENRYFLGIPSKIKNSLIRLKKNTRAFYNNPQYNKYLSLIKSGVEVGMNSQGIPIKIPELTFYSQKFCPPLYSQAKTMADIFFEILTEDQRRIVMKIDSETKFAKEMYGYDFME